MKLIIDIPDVAYEAYKEWHKNKVATVEQSLIANGIPYEERPQGEWIHRHIITKDRSFDMVVCSNCQTEFSWDAETGVSMDNYKTCPNCTADMRKGGAE